MLNGDCLRIIRGNSKNDPITTIRCSGDRYIIQFGMSMFFFFFFFFFLKITSAVPVQLSKNKQAVVASGQTCKVQSTRIELRFFSRVCSIEPNIPV